MDANTYLKWITFECKSTVASLRDEITAGYGVFANAFKRAGYHVAYAGAHIVSCDEIKKRWAAVDTCSERPFAERYLGHWLGQNQEMKRWFQSASQAYPAPDLSVIALFKAVPYSLRRHVYGKGRWLGIGDAAIADERIKNVLRQLSFVDSMHLASNVNSPTSTELAPIV